MQKQLTSYPNSLAVFTTHELTDGAIQFFGPDHFKFFSAKTHVFSGVIGLSTKHETYEYHDYTDGILHALSHLGLATPSDLEEVYLNDKPIKSPLENMTELVDLIQQLYPTNNDVNRDQLLAFYKNQSISFKFSLFKTEYLIRPIIIHDNINDQYYIHWEFGSKALFESQSPKYLFHFNGNGCNQALQFAQAAQLLALTSTIQVLIDYPNKGLNHILNPELRAYKTSVKGSINPHIAAYNYLVNKHGPLGFELIIYAYSYGNLAGAQFIPLMLLKNPQMKIKYLGFGVPATLRQVAHSYSSDKAMWFADTFHLLNEADVYKALNLDNVKALIFNNVADSVIVEIAQIQNHPEYIENKDKLKIIRIIEIKDVKSQHDQPLGYKIILTNNHHHDFNNIFAIEYANFF